MQIALGLFIGVFVLTQSTFQVATTGDKHQQEQQKDSNQKGKEQQVKINEAVTSPTSQINLDFQSFLLEEVHFDEKNEDQKSSEGFLAGSSQKVLRVLFRRIISPNAP